MNRCIWLIGFFLLSAFVENGKAGTVEYANVSKEVNPANIAYMDSAALDQKLKRRKEKLESFFVVDLRTEAEFAKGSVPDALNIPFSKLKFRAEKEIGLNEELIVFGYSSSDKMPENAYIFLTLKGYTNIKLLQGGWEQWKKFQESKREESNQ